MRAETVAGYHAGKWAVTAVRSQSKEVEMALLIS